MAIQVQVANGQTTVTLIYSGESAKIQTLLLAAAEALYVPETDQITGLPVTPFDDLTNPQKLAIINNHVRDNLVAIAEAFIVESAIEEARQQAQSDAANNLELE